MRVNGLRLGSTVTYSELPAGCQGVGTAAHVPGVGLVAGTYSDQLPWRGGTCAAVALLDPLTGATSSWRSTGGADVIDIAPIGDGLTVR